jgi:hypothetical protein
LEESEDERREIFELRLVQVREGSIYEGINGREEEKVLFAV